MSWTSLSLAAFEVITEGPDAKNAPPLPTPHYRPGKGKAITVKNDMANRYLEWVMGPTVRGQR
jgi:hypothetical protein